MAAPTAPGWALDKQGFRLYDGSQNNYGAPSGAGVTVEMPAATGNAFFRGTVTASKIQGSQGGAGGSGARMWFDFTAGDPVASPAGATPGVSPYWAITDPNGVIRVEAGILAALGASPLQWGMRVNDGSQRPIWDSLGLLGVNPAAFIQDGYPVTIGGGYNTIFKVALNPVGHAGTSFFVIAQVDVVATDASGVGLSIGATLSLDDAAPGFLGEPQAFVTVTPPFTNRDFPMGLMFWSFQVPDLQSHYLTVRAGSTAATTSVNPANVGQVNQSDVRLVILQLGN